MPKDIEFSSRSIVLRLSVLVGFFCLPTKLANRWERGRYRGPPSSFSPMYRELRAGVVTCRTPAAACAGLAEHNLEEIPSADVRYGSPAIENGDAALREAAALAQAKLDWRNRERRSNVSSAVRTHACEFDSGVVGSDGAVLRRRRSYRSITTCMFGIKLIIILI